MLSSFLLLTLDFANFDRVSTVPEPSTYMLMFSGLVGLMLFRRKQMTT
jgi:hypothetical protein